MSALMLSAREGFGVRLGSFRKTFDRAYSPSGCKENMSQERFKKDQFCLSDCLSVGVSQRGRVAHPGPLQPGGAVFLQGC
jgi:hypothetical protein